MLKMTLTKWFHQGYNARLEGAVETDNPYEDDVSQSHYDWWYGWNVANCEEQD